MSTRFTSARWVIDTVSFANDISQRYDGNFADNFSDFLSTSILPHPLVDNVCVATLSVSFLDHVSGNIVDNTFGGVSNFNFRSRGSIKVLGRYQSSPFKPSSSFPSKLSSTNSSVIVRFLRIKYKDIVVTICSVQFGITGLHACSSPAPFDNANGIKSYAINDQAFFEDALYICTLYKAQ